MLAAAGAGGATPAGATRPSRAGPSAAGPSTADPSAGGPPRPIVLRGGRIFDGRASTLLDGHDVLVADGRIAALVPTGQAVADADVVDCTAKVVMPGLIDAHWHSLLAAIPEQAALTADVAYLHLVAAEEAARTLLRGFTTVRDVGGPAFALKRAIDEGRFAGPRIFPAGAMISQTCGHGDFRFRNELPRTALSGPSAAEAAGISAIADGEAEVLRRVREQLMLGASQIKIMAGGGVSSQHDPIESVQFSEREMRAAVGAAADWGTYVCAHVYTSAGIRRALASGVASIEHGQLADEDTVRMIADAGAWWCLQPFLADEDANPQPTEVQRAEQRAIAEGTVRAFDLARKHGVKTAWGTDILFNPRGTAGQGRQLAKIARWFDAAEVLRLATSRNAELLGLSGARNPYPGALGVVAPGAHADLLVVDGDPLADITLLADPERTLALVMKGGRIHKTTLAR